MQTARLIPIEKQSPPSSPLFPLITPQEKKIFFLIFDFQSSPFRLIVSSKSEQNLPETEETQPRNDKEN